MNWQNDYECRITRVADVEDARDGWVVKCSEGWSLFVTNENCRVRPELGEAFLQFGRGIGHTVRGIVIGGRGYRYETKEQERERDAREAAQAKTRKRDEYEAKRSAFDARVAALPEPLRVRVERFRAVGGDEWRHEFEPYELFCCEQAAALAATELVLQDFARLPYEEQRKAWPGMSDDHSGNTFGATVRLASVVRERPELAARVHGAMCPLVGCDCYGCWAANEGRASS
jgi:hypothetical protein